MPKTARALMKSVKVVVSVSPAEYERWERLATQNEMRVSEFVRYLVGQAANWSNKMPYLFNLAALAVSPVQTGSDATVPALPMHMRPQFKISPALTLPGSKLAPSCAATIPVALKCTGIATGCAGIATGLQRELYRLSTGVSRDRDKRGHMFPPPATNVGPVVPPSSYKRGTSVPTSQLQT